MFNSESKSISTLTMRRELTSMSTFKTELKNIPILKGLWLMCLCVCMQVCWNFLYSLMDKVLFDFVFWTLHCCNVHGVNNIFDSPFPICFHYHFVLLVFLISSTFMFLLRYANVHVKGNDLTCKEMCHLIISDISSVVVVKHLSPCFHRVCLICTWCFQI